MGKWRELFDFASLSSIPTTKESTKELYYYYSLLLQAIAESIVYILLPDPIISHTKY